jgi:hypothetical protein
MTTPEQILTAAHQIRPLLPILLDPETAETFDHQLQTLLDQTIPNLDTLILQHLTSTDRTRDWTRRFLQGENLEAILRGLPPLPGDMSPVSASRTFICPIPDCPETWTQPSSGYRIPDCPTHNIPLIPSP